jgi:hypothetical protein
MAWSERQLEEVAVEEETLIKWQTHRGKVRLRMGKPVRLEVEARAWATKTTPLSSCSRMESLVCRQPLSL